MANLQYWHQVCLITESTCPLLCFVYVCLFLVFHVRPGHRDTLAKLCEEKAPWESDACATLHVGESFKQLHEYTTFICGAKSGCLNLFLTVVMYIFKALFLGYT